MVALAGFVLWYSSACAILASALTTPDVQVGRCSLPGGKLAPNHGTGTITKRHLSESQCKAALEAEHQKNTAYTSAETSGDARRICWILRHKGYGGFNNGHWGHKKCFVIKAKVSATKKLVRTQTRAERKQHQQKCREHYKNEITKRHPGRVTKNCDPKDQAYCLECALPNHRWRKGATQIAQTCTKCKRPKQAWNVDSHHNGHHKDGLDRIGFHVVFFQYDSITGQGKCSPWTNKKARYEYPGKSECSSKAGNQIAYSQCINSWFSKNSCTENVHPTLNNQSSFFRVGKYCTSRRLVMTKDEELKGEQGYTFAFCELLKTVTGALSTTDSYNKVATTPCTDRVDLNGAGRCWSDVPAQKQCPVQGVSKKFSKCIMACKAKKASKGPTIDGKQLPAVTSQVRNRWGSTCGDQHAGHGQACGAHETLISCFTAKGPFRRWGCFDGMTNLRQLGYLGNRELGMMYVEPDYASCKMKCDVAMCADYAASS